MARGKTPRKERGPGDYTALGHKGRRTGVELKDTGVRDEHGMEPLPSFSSPAKSLVPNGIIQDQTYSADDSMDIEQSTIADPTEVLKQSRGGRISLPPRATSPIKTHLNSSPRRSIAVSVGPMSSPSRNLNKGTPTRAASHPPAPVNRQLNFSLERQRRSVEPSAQKVPSSALEASKLSSFTGKGKNKRPFDLSMGEEDNGDEYDDEEETNAMIGDNTINGVINDDDDVLPNGDEQLIEDSILEQGGAEEQQGEETPKQDIEDEDSQMREPDATPGGKGTKRRRSGRPPKVVMVANDDSQISLSGPGSRARGRQKKAKTEVHRDEDAGQAIASSQTTKSKRKLVERDHNAKIKATKKSDNKPSSRRTGSVGPKANTVQRNETPANDNGALTTRSGRTSIKPLASWRGEKVVYGARTKTSLPGIAEVIRVDEIIEPRLKRSNYHRKGRPRAQSQLGDVEEVDEDLDPWETDTGIMIGQVMGWDPATGNNGIYDEENTVESEVAYAAEAIEPRAISGGDFRFAKTLSLPFFGSGMIELPPGGSKRVKNSRKMQLVFFVFYGRVTVEMGTPTTTFSIGKGGQWQVPRGNFYSISNESTAHTSRIFFAQGCEWTADAADESLAA